MKFEPSLGDSSEKGESLKDQLQKQVLEATLKTLQEKVSTLVCPTHGQSPRLQASEGEGPGKQKLSFQCCCDELRKIMEEKLKS